MNEMLDDRLDDLLGDAARDYNDPPETPREAMWERIVAERAQRVDQPEATKPAVVLPLRRSRHIPPVRWAAGIAALLAIGVGLGRLTVDRSPVVIVPAQIATNQPTSRVSVAAYQLATTEHLSQSEAFLTLFRTSLQRGGNQQLASATARQLLATNRLLLDSPAADDARTRTLLQDLELVLAGISQLSPQPRSRDLDLITEGLEQGGVLSRLRTAVPAGPSSTQGAL
jgi:hypothetical protein